MNSKISSLKEFEEYARREIAGDYNKHPDERDSPGTRITSKDFLTLCIQQNTSGFTGVFVTVSYNDILYIVSYNTVSGQLFIEVYNRVREIPKY